MDEYTRAFQLIETICASDAMNNARTVLEEAEDTLGEGLYERIRRFVFPVLEAESERLGEEYRRLRGLRDGAAARGCGARVLRLRDARAPRGEALGGTSRRGREAYRAPTEQVCRPPRAARVG
jgi:hypothetical protein